MADKVSKITLYKVRINFHKTDLAKFFTNQIIKLGSYYYYYCFYQKSNPAVHNINKSVQEKDTRRVLMGWENI